jgi:hypothetical protein
VTAVVQHRLSLPPRRRSGGGHASSPLRPVP